MNDENNKQPTAENGWTTKARPVLSASILVAVAALGASLGQSALRFLDDVRHELNDSARCCAAFQSYRGEDSEQRREWIKVIRANQERINEHEIELRILQSRPEHTTGGEHRDLEQRVEALEDIK